MYMFWNFITSGNNQQYQSEFESYVRSVMNNTHVENTPVMQKNSMENVAESFTNSVGDIVAGRVSSEGGFQPTLPNPEATKIEDAYSTEIFQDMLSSWKIKLLMLWNQLILKSFVRGKTIHVTRL